MTKAPERLMLLDTASMYFRAFHGVPDSITADDGTPVNAVRGLLDMIAFLVQQRRPRRLVACWDEDWRPAFRVEAIPSYKAHRLATPGRGGKADIEIVPPLLDAQLPIIVEALELLGIARVGAPGFEADDVIGTLVAKEKRRAGADVEVVSGDRDLFQVVDDARGVKVLYIGKGVRKLEVVDEKWLLDRYGIRGGGPGYADVAVLRGDPSDGLPGVAGIGEKTAVGLLNRFGDLAALREAVAAGDPSISGGQRKKLLDAADYLDRAPAVVIVAPDAPVNQADDTLPGTPPDHERLIAFAERWNLSSSVARVVQALG